MSHDVVIDLEDLERRLGADADLIKDLVGLFFADYPAQLDAIARALASADAAALTMSAHSLKGALANLSAPHARDAARALELAARTGDFTAAAAACERLKEEIERLREACAAFQARGCARRT